MQTRSGEYHRHLLLTGLPGVGKTTVLKKLARHFADRNPAGFYTEEIRVGGSRQGFRLTSLNGETGLLAHVDNKSSARVGRYGVDIQGFESFLTKLDLPSTSSQLAFIDEIGKMECLSRLFVEQMKKLLDSKMVVVATIAAKGGGFISAVKQRRECRLIEVKRGQGERLFAELVEQIGFLLRNRESSNID